MNRSTIECFSFEAYEKALAQMSGLQIFATSRRRLIIETEELLSDMVDRLRETSQLIEVR